MSSPISYSGYIPADEDHCKRERNVARKLQKTQWWKRLCSNGICTYCQKPVPPRELTMDHKVPIIRGGKTTKGNVAPCCKPCNNEKKSALLMEWEPQS